MPWLGASDMAQPACLAHGRQAYNLVFYNIASLTTTTQNVSSSIARAQQSTIYLYMPIYIYTNYIHTLYIGFSACLHELDSRPIFFFVLGNDYYWAAPMTAVLLYVSESAVCEWVCQCQCLPTGVLHYYPLPSTVPVVYWVVQMAAESKTSREESRGAWKEEEEASSPRPKSGGGLVKTYFHTTTAISLNSGGADGGSGRG